MNMHDPNNTRHILDDRLLQTYVDSINFHRDDPDLVLIDQLATIKSLINRKAFALTLEQVALIHPKFFNLNRHREQNVRD